MKDYNINIRNLNKLPSDIRFVIEKDFFLNEDNMLADDGYLEVIVDVIPCKKDSFDIIFKISGVIKLVCDNSLKKFDYKVNILKTVKFEFGKEDKELDRNYYVIKNDKTFLNLKEHIRDFINISVPIKKLHPEYQNTDRFKYICKG